MKSRELAWRRKRKRKSALNCRSARTVREFPLCHDEFLQLLPIVGLLHALAALYMVASSKALPTIWRAIGSRIFRSSSVKISASTGGNIPIGRLSAGRPVALKGTLCSVCPTEIGQRRRFNRRDSVIAHVSSLPAQSEAPSGLHVSLRDSSRLAEPYIIILKRLIILIFQLPRKIHRLPICRRIVCRAVFSNQSYISAPLPEL